MQQVIDRSITPVQRVVKIKSEFQNSFNNQAFGGGFANSINRTAAGGMNAVSYTTTAQPVHSNVNAKG